MLIQYLHFRMWHRRRPHRLCGVGGDRRPRLRVSKSTAQEPVDVSNGSWRQRSPVSAATAPYASVEALKMLRAQLLEWQAADVGNDVQAHKRFVSLLC